MSKPHLLLIGNHIASDVTERMTSFGYNVSVVEAARQDAVEHTSEIHPQVVFVCLSLQWDTGDLEIVDQIRTQCDVPVVYLTPDADRDTLRRAKIFTSLDYLLESFSERELNTTIEMALYKHRAEGEMLQRNRELLAFQTAAVAITANSDLQSVMNVVTRELVTLLGVTGCGVASWNQASNSVAFIATHGPLKGQPGSVYRLDDHPLMRRVLVESHRLHLTREQDDIRQTELEYLRQSGVNTLLLLPMIFQDRVVGLVQVVDEHKQHAFSDQEILLAQLLANQAAGVLQNTRIFEAEREQRALAEALRDTATALNSTPNFDEVLDAILANVHRVIPYHAANVMLVRAGKAFVTRSHSREDSGLDELGLALQFSIDDVLHLQQMSESGHPVVIPDTQTDSAWSGFNDARQVRSYLGAPIRAKGQVIGFLSLESAIANFFNPADAERLQVFTDQAAIAVENAQLYETVHRHADELEERVAERTRELAEANEQLKELDKMKDEFLANMSHELRTPLNAILGLSEALQEQVFGPLNEKQLRSLGSIEESGRHLLSLITDILDLCKIGVGKLTLELGPVSAESVSQSSIRLVKQIAHKKRLRLSSTLDSAVTMLQADERRLKQILVNLLSNAVKFTPDGGSVGLDIVGVAEKEIVNFTVWDTGLGIAQEDLGRLFQPFVQLDSSLARQHAGTGLGLALVYRMTEMHGGSVLVDSELGVGSRFTVSLPWRVPTEITTLESEAKLEEPNTPTPLSDQKPLILLAEDNEINISTLLDYLPARGYRVIVARDGNEAVQLAREESPDLILMDVQMPVMDGLEATKQIRDDVNLAKIPIIALTALAMRGDRERCLAAGMDDYLSKPVGMRDLIASIEKLRERRQEQEVLST